jgi:hypothetical protein
MRYDVMMHGKGSERMRICLFVMLCVMQEWILSV